MSNGIIAQTFISSVRLTYTASYHKRCCHFETNDKLVPVWVWTNKGMQQHNWILLDRGSASPQGCVRRSVSSWRRGICCIWWRPSIQQPACFKKWWTESHGSPKHVPRETTFYLFGVCTEEHKSPFRFSEYPVAQIRSNANSGWIKSTTKKTMGGGFHFLGL